MGEKIQKKLSTKDIVTKGSAIAILVTIPSLTAFGLSWYILDELIQSAIIGGVVHFIAMGFAFKISKKFFTTKHNSEPKN